MIPQKYYEMKHDLFDFHYHNDNHSNVIGGQMAKGEIERRLITLLEAIVLSS